MHKNTILSVLTCVLFCAITCFEEKIKRRYLGTKVVDFQETQMIKREIAAWKGAPEVEKLLIVTQSKLRNVAVYEIKYKAKNGDICEGEWIKTKIAVGKSQKSHVYNCYKEQMERKNLHAILEYDSPLFDSKEGAMPEHAKLHKEKEQVEKEKELEEKESYEEKDEDDDDGKDER